MHPQSRFDKPGKSPFMDMQLVPKYADEAAEEGSVTISPRVVQNLGVRTAEARRGSLALKLTAVGSVAYNERSVVLVQPRANGFIEKLHVRAPLDPVRAGDPLVEILFPDWAAAQEEFLLLRKRADPRHRDLASAARQRLMLARHERGADRRVEREGKARPRVTLRAPVSGVVVELGAREGMTVASGSTLFRIAGLGYGVGGGAGARSAGRLARAGQPRRSARARVSRRGVRGAGQRDPAGSERGHAHGARAHRGREPRRQAQARHVREPRLRRAGRRGPAGAGRGGDPHRRDGAS